MSGSTMAHKCVSEDRADDTAVATGGADITCAEVALELAESYMPKGQHTNHSANLVRDTHGLRENDREIEAGQVDIQEKVLRLLGLGLCGGWSSRSL